MKKFWQNFEKLFGIYRWHPKIALRYLPVVRELKTRDLEKDVLEVGSGGLGISPYIKEKIVGVDTEFSSPIYEKLVPVIAFAEKLPFSDSSFKAVISLDMLEHLPHKNRGIAIGEMLRVADKFVCLGCPMGQPAHIQDTKLRQEYKKRSGKDFIYLQEQVDYGVPDLEEILDVIRKKSLLLHKTYRIQILSNINITFRKFLMRGWLSRNIFTNFLFRKLFLIFIPLFLKFNREPVYRKIILIDLL